MGASPEKFWELIIEAEHRPRLKRLLEEREALLRFAYDIREAAESAPRGKAAEVIAFAERP